MATSGKIGSFRPLSFRHNGKPVNPGSPRGVDKSASAKGIAFSGKSSQAEFVNKLKSLSNLSPQGLGKSAVSLQKSSGISVNVTI